MRISCPHCGERDRREYYYQGRVLDRPSPDAGEAAWQDYLHLRENPAGPTVERWQHEPCGTWINVRRDTVTHDIEAVALPEGAGS